MSHLRGALTQMWNPESSSPQDFVAAALDLVALVSTFAATVLTLGSPGWRVAA